MKLSELCRKAANNLRESTFTVRPAGGIVIDSSKTFMCLSAKDVLGYFDYAVFDPDNKHLLDKFLMNEFNSILFEGGIENMNGMLFTSMSEYSYDYDTIAQPIRFMYLNFLAEMLEVENQ